MIRRGKVRTVRTPCLEFGNCAEDISPPENPAAVEGEERVNANPFVHRPGLEG